MNNPYEYQDYPPDESHSASQSPQLLQNVFGDDFSFDVNIQNPNLHTSLHHSAADAHHLHPTAPFHQHQASMIASELSMGDFSVPVASHESPLPPSFPPQASPPLPVSANVSEADQYQRYISPRRSEPVKTDRKRSRNPPEGPPADVADHELKPLAYKASHLSFDELAVKIKLIENDENIPSSKSVLTASPNEFTKESHSQVFGMVWLIKSCELNPTSVVPRNKVYVKYVEVCARHCLYPLSPGHLGKLVRIIYPNLTVRRLGIRGQSRYHYCGLKLLEDELPEESQPQEETFEDEDPLVPAKFARVAKEVDLPPLRYIENVFEVIDNSNMFRNANRPINIPSIYPYLRNDVDYDIDIVDTLYSLYKIHCTTIFESLRYMKINKLFDSFSNFISILTLPVFKLYTSEPVIAWVNECDKMTYKMMIKMISKLHKQTIPPDVVDQLNRMCSQYSDKLLQSLTNKIPEPFIAMKLKAAKMFVNTLKRLLRVVDLNEKIQRALGDHQNCQQIIQALDAIDIQSIVFSRSPLAQDKLGTLVDLLNHSLPALLREKFDLNRYLHFVGTIPRAFSSVNTGLFAMTLTNILSSIFNQMLVNKTSNSILHNFWVLKTWMNEFLYLHLELGGMFAHETPQPQEVPPPFQVTVQPQHEASIKEEPELEDSGLFNQSAEHLNDSSIVDLIDGAYGQDVEPILNYDHIESEYLS